MLIRSGQKNRIKKHNKWIFKIRRQRERVDGWSSDAKKPRAQKTRHVSCVIL